MRKLLILGGGGIFAMLVALWYLTHSQVDAAPTAPPAPRAARTPQTPHFESEPPAQAPKKVAAKTAQPAPESEDGKVNPNSDEFFDRFVERQPKIVSRAAMSCYPGHHLGMDNWIKINFVGHIRNGEITFTNVVAKESHLDDPALESCMLDAIGKAHMHDDSLPDTEGYPDQVVLNPERGGKKYMRSSDD